MTETIIEQLTEYIASEIVKRPDAEISPEEALLTSGLVDSFALVDLSLFIEETFGVIIENTELNANHFDSIVELAKMIQERKE